MRDHAKARAPDASRIGIDEEHEVLYWAERFGCSRQDLINAVRTVGSRPSAVELWLRTNRQVR